MLQGPAILPEEEVWGGQRWAKSAGCRLVFPSSAEQVWPCRAAWGPYRPAVGLTCRVLQRLHPVLWPVRARRGVCHNSALISEALNLSWESFDSPGWGGFNLAFTWKVAQLHLMPSQKGLLSALPFWWEPTTPVPFLPQLQIREALALTDADTYPYGHTAFLTF